MRGGPRNKQLLSEYNKVLIKSPTPRLNPKEVETLKKNLHYFISLLRSFEINPKIVLRFTSS